MTTAKQQIIDKLLKLPQEINDAELDLIRVQKMLSKSQEKLHLKEIEIQTGVREDLSPVLDGKNAETRAAQLKCMTIAQREDVMIYEASIPEYRALVSLRQNELSAYRAISRIMGVE
jgi:hypothetical protein